MTYYFRKEFLELLKQIRIWFHQSLYSEVHLDHVDLLFIMGFQSVNELLVDVWSFMLKFERNKKKKLEYLNFLNKFYRTWHVHLVL